MSNHPRGNLDVDVDNVFPLDPRLETLLPDGITGFGNAGTVKSFVDLSMRYKAARIEHGGTVDILEEEWMEIPLLDGWERIVKPHMVYPLSPKDEAVVVEQFDKLYEQGEMHWTNEYTPLSLFKGAFAYKGTPALFSPIEMARLPV